MYQKWMSSLVVVGIAISAVSAQAQDRATVQLRDGSKFEGRVEEMTGGELFVRVSQNDQRRVPVGSVALIDRVGGASGLPDTELREAAGSQHLLLLSNGSSLRGQLVAIRGGQGSANENEPRAYVFRADGQERSFTSDQVSRVYMGQYPFASITGSTTAPTENSAAGLDPGAVVPGAIRVPAAAGWVATGMRVRRGEVISFSTTGEVQLSESGADRARSAGASRTAPGAPLPNVAAGALIGRVGNSQAFGIGNQTSVPMPFDGMLYLAVNDDERSDNAGEFVVTMGRVRR
jgi:hypothetical protein